MLREKADMGDPKAMSDLGATYFQGDELPRDHSTAFAWFERSATASYTLAFLNLATCYREELGCPKDERKALECYKVVAEVETDAMELLGEIYMNGDCGVAKDRGGCVLVSTRRGSRVAGVLVPVGRLLRHGHRRGEDFGNAAGAFQVRRRARARGRRPRPRPHPLAHGLGIIGDEEIDGVWKLTPKPRRRGYPRRATTWDARGSTGNGTKGGASAGKAAQWFQRAAEAGHPAACAELAALLHVGAPAVSAPRGVRKDVPAAKAWYERAVALGVTDAAAALGRMHRDGVGGDETTRDLDEAARWFRVSAAGGRRRFGSGAHRPGEGEGAQGSAAADTGGNTTPRGARSCPRLRSRRRLRTTT